MPADPTARRAAVLKGMVEALPTHPKDDSSSDLSSSYEAIALLVHAYMTTLRFRLLGFDEDNRTEQECTSLAPRLPPKWNSSFGSHTLHYAHKQSSLTFLLKVDRLASKAEIRGLALGDERIHRFEFSTRDVIRSAGLPVRITLSPDGEEDRSDLVDRLRGVFVSDEKLDEVLSHLQSDIVQKLIPKLQVEGYEEVEVEEDRGTGRREAGDGQRDPQRDPHSPGLAQPMRPFHDPSPLPHPVPHPAPAGEFNPPGFEDEYEILRQPRGALPGPGFSPYGIGHDDLNPPGLGPHDPLRPHLGGAGLPRPGGFSGMHPTFDDPLFQGPGRSRGQGSGGFDPQAPPGARWDPVGPGGGPRPRQGGGPGAGFGGDII